MRLALCALVTFLWDPSPDGTVTRYYVWSWDATRTVQSWSDGTNCTAAAELAPGHWRAYAVATDGEGLESEPSNVITFDIPQEITLTLEIERSEDLQTWRCDSALTVRLPAAGSGFIRSRLVIHNP